MKCIKEVKGSKIKRVSDDFATEKVNSGKFNYCSKSEWKEKVRDKDK